MRAVLLTVLAAALLSAQTAPTTCATVSPAAAKSEFDAASVKPAGPPRPGEGYGGAPSGGPGTSDPGRIIASHISLAALIGMAYDVWTDRLSAPDWMSDAENHGFTISATMPVTTTRDQYCGMLRNLLTSRFHLTTHREMQPRPGYELTLLPGGPKFKLHDPAARGPEAEDEGRIQRDIDAFQPLPSAARRYFATTTSPAGLRRMSFRGEMAGLAQQLETAINQANGIKGFSEPRPRVADSTGLTGIYDVHLEYAGPPRDPNARPDPVDAGPNIFNAVQQQLGLKLQKVKDLQVEVLIVDHADQTPTEN